MQLFAKSPPPLTLAVVVLTTLDDGAQGTLVLFLQTAGEAKDGAAVR